LQVGKADLPPLEGADGSQEQKTIFHITFVISHLPFLICRLSLERFGNAKTADEE
jgi:hypothetical protein